MTMYVCILHRLRRRHYCIYHRYLMLYRHALPLHMYTHMIESEHTYDRIENFQQSVSVCLLICMFVDL